MKKVLIITYYWPPAGGPGVQRVLKFVKYLPQYGWQPLVLTVRNGAYPALDPSLSKDIPKECIVHQTPSFEPTLLYKRFVGMDEDQPIPNAVVTEENPNWKKKLAAKIRLNLFIPDAKITWLPPAVKTGRKIVHAHRPAVIFSSSPPPTVHLIAKKLQRESGLPWVTDFRDPWTDMYYYDKVQKSDWATRLDKKLELEVLQKSNRILTVSNQLKQLFGSKIGSSKRIRIVPNGFDEDDLAPFTNSEPFEKFTLAYAGKLNSQQNPENLWQALEHLLQTKAGFSENFQLLYMGHFAPEVEYSIKKHGLKNNLNYTGYLEHDKMLQHLSKSHLLLLVVPQAKDNKGILTGKVFEYLGIRRFILAIGPTDGDLAGILHQTESGTMFDFKDQPESFLEKLYDHWVESHTALRTKGDISAYSRKAQTEQLAFLFKQLTETQGM